MNEWMEEWCVGMNKNEWMNGIKLKWIEWKRVMRGYKEQERINKTQNNNTNTIQSVDVQRVNPLDKACCVCKTTHKKQTTNK